MWELNQKKAECWCFETVVLEKTLESPLGSKVIKSVNPKGNQPWIFIARTDAEAEAPTLWPPNSKSWLIGKDWGQEKRARGWGSCMASPTQWMWVWANSGRWWRTGKPGMLQSMGLQSWTRLCNGTKTKINTYVISKNKFVVLSYREIVNFFAHFKGWEFLCQHPLLVWDGGEPERIWWDPLTVTTSQLAAGWLLWCWCRDLPGAPELIQSLRWRH